MGHSLGAGVACLLALMLRSDPATRHWRNRLACRLLSPVGGLLSKRIADATGDASFDALPPPRHSSSSGNSSSSTYDVAAAAVLTGCSDSTYSGSDSGTFSTEGESTMVEAENSDVNRSGSESIAWDCASALFRDEAVPRLSVR